MCTALCLCIGSSWGQSLYVVPSVFQVVLLLQEICSFLKGSAEAMDSPDGKLSLESYLEVGRKRAPNFTADTRHEVYPVFEKYEREKLRLNRCVCL